MCFHQRGSLRYKEHFVQWKLCNAFNHEKQISFIDASHLAACLQCATYPAGNFISQKQLITALLMGNNVDMSFICFHLFCLVMKP